MKHIRVLEYGKMKSWKILETRKSQYFLIGILAVLLFCIIGKNIFKICTVWELSDEAGYVFNAAYFIGRDWSDVRATMAYYAYGYSVFLIPAFLFCKTGVAFIQSACLLNVLCIIGIYFLQIYVLGRIFPAGRKIHFAIASFIACLNSFLISNALKVDCECVLALWIWIIAILLYKAIKFGKKRYYCILSLCSSYIFFIHTRGFVTLALVYLAILGTAILYRNKEIFKNMMFSIVMMGLIFLIGYSVKMSILDYAARVSIETGNVVSKANLLTSDIVIGMFRSFFALDNILLYMKGFAARCFYIAYSSGTMAIFGVIALGEGLYKEWRHKGKDKIENEKIAVYGLKLFLLTNAFFAVLACVVSNPGSNKDFVSFFFNRYYEHAVIPLIGIGICGLIYAKENKRMMAMIIFIMNMVGLFVMQISDILNNQSIRKDTARISGMASAIEINDNYTHMILYATMVISLLLVLFGFVQKHKNLKWIYLICIAAFIWKSSSLDIEVILGVNERARADAELAQIVLSQENSQSVYMMDSPYPYPAYYARVQVLIKDKKLNVITKGDVSNVVSGSYIFTYHDYDVNEMETESCNFIRGGDVFNLYQKK